MMNDEKTIEFGCPSPDISAYVDGELPADAEARLEMHLAECNVCSTDLNLQKSFLNALGSSLEREEQIELPSNFAKAVVANAESRVSGLRHPHERRNAAFICTALIVFSVLAFGSNTEATLAATGAVAEKFLAVAASVTHFAHDLALGSAIVFRTLVSKFVFGSETALLLLIAALLSSLFVFSRLLVRFHRT